MPVYDYKCPGCEKKLDDVFVHRHDEEVKCPRCRALMKRLFPNSAKFIGAKVFPSEGIYLEHVSGAGGGGKRFHSENEMRQHEKDTGDTIARLH